MTEPLLMQITLAAEPGRIFDALTQRLPDWFAEYADVSLDEKRYDFWGRYTPEAPDREAGRHPLLFVAANRELRYGWALRGRGIDSAVHIRLLPRGAQTIVAVQHSEINPDHSISAYTDEDFWFLSLENLRRHLDGKAPVRCDFTQSMLGDIHHTVEIEASPSAVFAALITPDQLNRWIASHSQVEAHVGGTFDLGWSGFPPLKILELVPDQKLALRWSEGEEETVVTWTLEGSGGKTRMTLVHSGFAPDKPTGGLKAGWLNFASWVKSLCEYGPSWQPTIKRLAPGTEPYYAAAIGSAQSTLVAIAE